MSPKIVLGTFQNNRYLDLLNVVDSAFLNGCTAFDTAPSYGTEVDLGKALEFCMDKYHVNRKDVFVSDKVDAWQMIKGRGDVCIYIQNALEKMNLEYFDIVWVHWPIAEFIEPTWRSLQELQGKGVVKNIGISNVRVRHLREMAQREILPKYIQIERHPLRVCQEEMDYCKAHGIEVFSYSPICRMHKDLKESAVLKHIADKYHKNIGQVILRWHVDTHATPVFMSKNPKRVSENLNIFDFELTENEVEAISCLNQNYKIFLESWGCPGF